jgi:hypothetical protein
MRTFDIYETSGIYQMINVTHNGTITTYDDYYHGGPISTDPDGDKVWDDSPSQKAEVAGHYYTDITYDYFLNTHGRDSYDGYGHDVLVNVHDQSIINNASWYGQSLNFSDGDGVNFLPFSGSLDVVAHEFAHAVTEYSAGLIYAFQSGALSESVSDVFACMIDRDDWLIAEEISLTGGFIRSLQDPALTGLPKHMDDYRILPLEQDNGGVHINCGIPNHACYRVSAMIGRDKVEQILYRTLTIYLTPGSGFYFWAGMIMQSAIDLYGPSSTEASEVELGLIWVGLGTPYALPQYIQLGAVSGEIGSENIWIYNPGTSTGSVDVSAVTPSQPGLTLSAGPGYQETIPDGDSSEFILSFDATGLGDCDLGIYYDYDTVRFDVDGPYGITQLKLPLVLILGITTSSLESEAFASSCIVTYASNTSNLDEFSRDSINALYGATLMIGVVDGSETRVYRDIYGTQSLAPVDSIQSDDGMVSFATVSEDGRIRAKVTYTYGPDDPEACGFVIVDYSLYNLCDTPLTLLNGLFADFDMVNWSTNLAGFDEGCEMVYMTDSLNTWSAGMALLSGSSRNLRAVHNPTSVWDGAFTDQAVYDLMVNECNVDGPTYDDWSALLTFGYGQLSQADTLEYQVALLYSNSGSGDLGQILDDAIDWLGGGYLCGDANADQSVDMLDILHLISYLYKGGPAPDPVEAADVNNDTKIDMLDILDLINYLYKGGPEPVCP